MIIRLFNNKTTRLCTAQKEVTAVEIIHTYHLCAILIDGDSPVTVEGAQCRVGEEQMLLGMGELGEDLALVI